MYFSNKVSNCAADVVDVFVFHFGDRLFDIKTLQFDQFDIRSASAVHVHVAVAELCRAYSWPDRITVPLAAVGSYEVGQLCWLESDMLEASGLHIVVDVSTTWADGGRNPAMTLQLARFAE